MKINSEDYKANQIKQIKNQDPMTQKWINYVYKVVYLHQRDLMRCRKRFGDTNLRLNNQKRIVMFLWNKLEHQKLI